MLAVVLRIQQSPPDHRGGYDLESREIRCEAETYEEIAQLRTSGMFSLRLSRCHVHVVCHGWCM